MNVTKLIILLVILVLLVGALWYTQELQKKSRAIPRITQTSAMFPDLEENGIFRMEVTSLQTPLLYRKNAGVWEVSTGRDVMGELMRNSEVQQSGVEVEDAVNPRDDIGPAGDPFRRFYKADIDKLQPMIDAILEMETGQIATSSPEEQSTLGVLSKIVGTEVVMYDQQMNELASVIIGNQGLGMATTFVRRPESDDIYEIRGNLSMIFGNDLVTMRDREIFEDAPETIASVEVQDNEEGFFYTLTRGEGIWTGVTTDGTELELDTAKVDSLLSTLGSLSANSFVDPSRPPMPPPEEEGWDETDPWGMFNPNVVVTYTTVDGETHEITVGRVEGTTYYAYEGVDIMDAFRISKTYVDNISPDPAMLAPGEEDLSGANAQLLGGDLVDQGEMIEMDINLIPADEIEGQ